MNTYMDFDVEDVLKEDKFEKKIVFGTGKTLKAGDVVQIAKFFEERGIEGIHFETPYPNRNLIVIQALKLGLDSNYVTIFGYELGENKPSTKVYCVTSERFIRKDLLQTVRLKLEHKMS